MGLFGKKKKEDNEINNKGLMKSFDMMQYYTLKSIDTEEVLTIADCVLSGKPVLANLDKLTVSEVNYVLSFMSGVVYATEGHTVTLSERLYLFARKQEFEDGSLNEFVEDSK